LKGWVRDTLHPTRLARHGLFAPDRVTALVDALSDPGADYRTVNKVLVLLMFQEWHDQYVG
ncbi:MAG TPA: asparagine synthase-related protein, partial [Vicinamibacterales bacterium]